ncbi:F-actin-capping protein [Actinomortierella ambigua]|nr:F-actin-capping protein [Actinomortierella ambigua]
MATSEEKIKIASHFLRAAPPDVRVLVNDDNLLQEHIMGALEEYNVEQLATIKVPGIEHEVIISKFGQIDNDHFIDPKSSKVFKLDHLRQVATDVEDHTPDESMEELRKAVESAVDDYTTNYYAEGLGAVYASSSEGKVTVAIVHNKYSPSNFWNGRWRSVWTLEPESGKVSGLLKAHVHYYEDGNVQLETNKEIEETLAAKYVGGDHPLTERAAAFVKLIHAAETGYQKALNESYHDLAESTFKSLRRALPYTRQKIDWNKILTYRIGAELSSK